MTSTPPTHEEVAAIAIALQRLAPSAETQPTTSTMSRWRRSARRFDTTEPRFNQRDVR